MFFESETLDGEFSGRVATIWLKGATILQLGHLLHQVRKNSFVDILVLRGLQTLQPDPLEATDPLGAAREAKQVLEQLVALPVVSLAYLEGPCLNRVFELALACDYRLAVATPDTWIGIEDRPRWGSTARAKPLAGSVPRGRWTAREAQAMGWIDQVVCERRAKIELRTWLDRLELSPRKRTRSFWALLRESARNQREWVRFVRSIGESTKPHNIPPTARRPLGPITTIELRGCPQASAFASEFLLSGGMIRTNNPLPIEQYLTIARDRRRVTPLEYTQALQRLTSNGPSRLILTSESDSPDGIVRAELRPHSQSVRVGFPIFDDHHIVELTSSTATEELIDLFRSMGISCLRVEDTPALAVRPALSRFWGEAVRLVSDGYPIDLIESIGGKFSVHPPLRTLDRLGMARAAEFVPQLRPCVDAGLNELFFDNELDHEPNSLAQCMLGMRPRLAIEREEQEELSIEMMRMEIEQRFRECLYEIDAKIARAAGLAVVERTVINTAAERNRRSAA